MLERRQHYRVSATYAKDVVIQLIFNKGELQVQAKDLSAGGAGVLVPAKYQTALQPGGMVELMFSAPWCKSVRIQGKVIRLVEQEEGNFEIGLVFTDWERRRDSLGHRLRRIFNERRVYRAETSPANPPLGSFTVASDGSTYSLKVLEVGVYGVRLELQEEMEVDEKTTARLAMDFGRGVVTLPCNVRHIQDDFQGRELVSAGVHFFSLERGGNSIEQAIIDYVFKLQRRR
jgi:c-di-GMP-binding flagellar brake protein YcgR